MAAKLIINNHLRTLTASPPPLSSALSSALSAFRRKLHESAYEKAVEDEVDADVEVIAPVEDALHQPEEYWEPDPETELFVPASEQSSDDPVVQVTCTTGETVLDEKAFFRPQEDLEAPSSESFTGETPPVDPFAESE